MKREDQLDILSNIHTLLHEVGDLPREAEIHLKNAISEVEKVECIVRDSKEHHNTLIAEFMGRKVVSEQYYRENKGKDFKDFIFDSSLNYHNSWDSLMVVVEKIEEDESIDVNIFQNGTIILKDQKEIVNNVGNISFDKKIEHTYDAVVKYVDKVKHKTGVVYTSL